MPSKLESLRIHSIFYMKNLKTTIIVLSTACILLFTNMQCKKDRNLDPDGLPKATQTGMRIFACKVNGVNWISTKESLDMDAAVSIDRINLYGTNHTAENPGTFKIFIANPGEDKVFRLNEPNKSFALYLADKDCSKFTGRQGFEELKSSDGEVRFTRIDLDKKIISGTFWFDIPTEKCGTIKVTNGRFDIGY